MAHSKGLNKLWEQHSWRALVNLGNDQFQGPYQIMETTHLKGLSESWEWPIPKALSQAWSSFASMPWKLDQNVLGNISYNNVKYNFIM